jgi:hypothetical protein
MYLNCERAELNQSTGELAVHYAGMISAFRDPVYGVKVSDVPECAGCGRAMLPGEVAHSIDGRLYHPVCGGCECRVHRKKIERGVVIPVDVRTGEILQLELFK